MKIYDLIPSALCNKKKRIVIKDIEGIKGKNKKNEEIDYLLDDYENSSVIPIEVKSGKDYKVHSALNEYLNSGRYNAKKGYVLNNNWQIEIKEKIIYMPIYYVMFF